jgi:hypothetical protein
MPTKLPKSLTNPSPLISFPARVQNYIDAQSGLKDAPYLLPVSCALTIGDTAEGLFKAMVWIKRGAGVKMIFNDLPKFTSEDSGQTIVAQDSLITDDKEAGDAGILECLIAKAEYGHDIDFSNLREKGAPCTGGIFASGRESFESLANALDAYRYDPTMGNLLYLVGLMNSVMIRGGYNKGIIITSFKVTHPRFNEFLSVDLGQIPGSLKREGRLGVDYLADYASLTDEQKLAIVEARKFSSLLLSKEKLDKEGRTIYTNVCEGIYLKPNDSCLIVRVPLGRLEIKDIRKAYKEAYKAGKDLWEYWHKNAPTEYPFADADTDRQIAIDPFGFANMLARLQITYDEFIEAYWQVVDNNVKKLTVAHKLVKQLIMAHEDVALLNRRAGNGSPFFERVFTVEPSQAHAFREKDLDGYTFARGIWAVWDQYVQRDSNHGGSQVYEYPTFETIKTQPDYVNTQERISEVWWDMMNRTGLAHAISHDTYYEPNLNDLTKWVVWGLPSLYYNFYSEAKQVVSKTVEEISFEGFDLSMASDTPTCDPTAGFCQVCGS